MAIGPWCFSGHPDAERILSEMGFEDLYCDSDELAADAEKIATLANAICADKLDSFNTLHATDYGAEFWRILLLPWILWISQAAWVRYRYLSRLVDRYGDQAITADIPSLDHQWHVADMTSLHRNCLQAPAFNEWLSARVLSEIAPINWSLRQRGVLHIEQNIEVAHLPRYRRFARWMKSLITDQRCCRVYGINKQAWLFSVFLSAIKTKPTTRCTLPAPKFSQVSAEFPLSFLNILADTLNRTIPKALSSEFERFNRRAAKRRYTPGRINLIGPLLILNEKEKFVLAHAVERGERIVCTQHGSSGYQRVNINSVEIENRQDAYFSWGWLEQGNYPGNIRPLPSPYYLRYRGQARPEVQKLLYVATAARIYGHRLETAFQPMQAAQYPARIIRFFRSLTPDLLEKSMFRPYRGDTGVIDTLGPVRQAFQSLEVHSGPLHRDILRMRLSVIDHYGTSFAIALVANTPTILIWDRDVWDIVHQAEDVFAELCEVGIAQTDPESGGKFASEIWDDVNGWWQSEDVQRARTNFCNRYALTDPAWFRRWLRELKNT